MNEFVKAAQELCVLLVGEVHRLGGRCHGQEPPIDPDDLCGMCDECQSDLDAAQRALLMLLGRHRPQVPDVPEGAPPLYPGWTSPCVECGQHYPCVEVRDMCAGLCVEIPEILRKVVS